MWESPAFVVVVVGEVGEERADETCPLEDSSVYAEDDEDDERGMSSASGEDIRELG